MSGTTLLQTLIYFVGVAIPAITIWIVIVLQLLGGSLIAAVSGGAIIGFVCMLMVIILPYRRSFPSGQHQNESRYGLGELGGPP